MSRDVIQYDILSQSIFSLVVEPYFRRLMRVLEASAPRIGNIPISVLAYADDVALLTTDELVLPQVNLILWVFHSIVSLPLPSVENLQIGDAFRRFSSLQETH